MDLMQIARRTLRLEAEAILDMEKRLDEEFLNAIDILYSCEGRVVITGMGKSGIIGKKISSTLASTGTPSLFLHPAEGVHGDLGMLVKGDVVVAISSSGETEELVSILPVIKRLDIPLVSIIGRKKCTLSNYSDCILDASITKEACPLNLVPTTSTTTALALGDALAIALLEKRGFKEEDFAFVHPSGILGKKLLLKVEDLYHTGKDMPVVNENSFVSEAVLQMSGKGLGCTAIVTGNGVLKGIITDGDIRRGIEKYKDIFTMRAKNIGTINPIIVTKDTLAARALQIMEEKSIIVLLVMDELNKLGGVIHLHDILRTGIC